MFWSFLWRFVLFVAILAPSLTRAAGLWVGANGGGYEDARNLGFAAEAVAAAVAAAAAYYGARRATKA